jgi:hypothetical protein
MRTFLAIAVVAVALGLAGQAQAQWIGGQIGNFTFWSNGSTGQTVTCTRVGNYTFCN